MNVPWSGERCILCLGGHQLTTQHVVPRALGGKLTCRFLCGDCNSTLGSDLEAHSKYDAIIVRLAAESRGANSRLDALVDSLPHTGQSGRGPVSGFIRNDEFRIFSKELDDGSIIKPSDQARQTVLTMLERAGGHDDEIQEALEKLDGIREGEASEITPGIVVVDWPVWEVKPDLSKGRIMSPLVPAFIAFQFLALLVGDAICAEAKALSELRSVFSNRTPRSDLLSVDRMYADRADHPLFHGIAFEGNDPHATVQVRLLGRLAFRVHFHHLSVSSRRFRYTHNLESGEEYCSWLD